MITALYAAIFALMAVALTLNVIATRRKERIGFGNGGNELLARKRSAHSNFIEQTPLFVILLFLIERQALVNDLGLYVLGGVFLFARFAHAYGILTPPGYGFGRVIGMVLSLSVLLACVGILLFGYITAL